MKNAFQEARELAANLTKELGFQVSAEYLVSIGRGIVWPTTGPSAKERDKRLKTMSFYLGKPICNGLYIAL